VEPDSTAGFKQRALVEMKETAKAQVSKNKNELLAARKLEVSLDRADNVIEGGTPFHTTQTNAFDFPSAGSLPGRVCRRCEIGCCAWQARVTSRP
jgi:hypothetical protein